MTTGKRTEITIETDQILIIRRRSSTQVWCRECGREVNIVGLGEAGVLTGMSGQALRDCAQAPRLAHRPRPRRSRPHLFGVVAEVEVKWRCQRHKTYGS